MRYWLSAEVAFMGDLSIAVIQGIVEGLTEFIPVSSTGHLIIVGHLLGLTGPKAAAFDIVIQLGAILSVVALYYRKWWGMVHPEPGVRFAGINGLWLLFLTCLPAATLGFFTHGFIEDKLFGPLTVALALAVGAVLILLVEKFKPAPKVADLEGMTPRLALGIGFFQCLSLWPGFSRSASTILGGMILGADRRLATEYSFLAAVPIMFMATGYKLLSSYKLFAADDFLFLAVGFVVSFLAALVAVKGFIHLVSRVSLAPFAWYRLILAPVVYLYFM